MAPPPLLQAKDGLLLPSACELLVCLSSHDRQGFWSDVYGFDMTPLASLAVAEATVELVPHEKALSPAAPLRRFEIGSVADAQLDFSAPFSLAAATAGTLRCLVLHFDTFFALGAAGGADSSFSTGSGATPTHWKQTALHLKAPLELAAGDEVSGIIGCTRAAAYRRGYDVSLTFRLNGGEQHTQLFKMH